MKSIHTMAYLQESYGKTSLSSFESRTSRELILHLNPTNSICSYATRHT